MQTLGPYTILEQLGSGGQGVVYLAEDTRLKRRVALKVLDAASLGGQDERLERFRREAEAASRLDHPNICAVHEAGEADGVPYIAMRYVEGTSLAEVIDAANERAASDGSDSAPSSRDDIHAVLRKIEKVARALHVAHEHGLVHRDIKPGNIMLTPEGEPVILDFGLARDELADDHSLTHSGDLLGTPAYMSPEQLMAQRIPLDRRTDVYSLGATLYQCLTLRRPFAAATRAELYQRILTQEPSSAGSLNRALPRDLQVVIETALEKDRDRRYQTALDLAEDLRRVREFEPIHAKPIGRLLRTKRWAQRRPAQAVGLVGLIVALLISAVFLARTQRDLRRTRAIALAAASTQALPKDPSLALLLARVAVGLDRTPETISPLYEGFGRHNERVVFRHDAGVIGVAANDAIIATASDDTTTRIWTHEGELQYVVRHDAPVKALALSPDGRFVASGSSDGELQISRVEGELMARWPGHSDAVTALQFVPGEEVTLLSGSDDGTARLWTVAGEQIVEFDQGTNVGAAAASPDGETILTTVQYQATNTVERRDDFTARLWSRDGRRVSELVGHSDSVAFARFSGDGEMIFTGSNDRTARVWSSDGELVLTLQHPAKVWAVDLHTTDDGPRILTACLDGKIRQWDLDGRCRNVVHEHGSSVQGIAVAADGRHFASVSWDQTAKWFGPNGEALDEFLGHTAMLTPENLDLVDGGRRVLTGALDGTARLWDTRVEGTLVLRGHASGVCSAAFSPDGDSILTSGVDATVRLWTSDGDPIREYRGATDWVNAAEFSSDGRFVSAASDDGSAYVWRTEDGSLVHTLRGATPRGMHNAPFCDGDSVIAAVSSDGVTMLFDAESGAKTGSIGSVGDAVNWFADGSAADPYIVIPQADGNVRIWNVRTSALVCEFPTHPARVIEAKFSPDGRLVATASTDGLARIWAVEGGEPVICRGHQGEVMSCAFSPDGAQLATSSSDGTIRLWDLEGREIAVLRGHAGTVWDVDFSPDGRRLSSSSFDKTARTWIADPDELIRRVDERLERLGRDFTESELVRYGELLGR